MSLSSDNEYELHKNNMKTKFIDKMFDNLKIDQTSKERKEMENTNFNGKIKDNVRMHLEAANQE